MPYSKENKWIEFNLIIEKSKTNVYAVLSKSSGFEIGIVKWHPSWRQYCFFPSMEEQTVYSDGCLLCIASFLKELTDLHKKR